MTKLNLLYASEMGTAMEVADSVSEIAKNKSIDVDQAELNDVSMDDLLTMNKVLSSRHDSFSCRWGSDRWVFLM